MSDKWKVDYSDKALLDLQMLHDHIAFTLLEPVVAARQSDRIMDAADSLDHMPFRYRLYDREPWRTRGLRVLPVDNYLIFYLPDKVETTVTIIRIMYGGRDVDAQLNAGG